MSGRKNKARRAGSSKGSRSRGKGLSKGWTWALVGLVALGFVAFIGEPLWRPMLSAPVSTAERVARGGQLYATYCAACHGPNAVGQDLSRPNGGQRVDGTYIAPALNGTAHAWHHPPRQLFDVIKYGSPAKDSPMKGWSASMSDEDIHSVIAYIQSLWPPALRERYHGMHGRS